MMERQFGRLREFDERSRGYLVRNSVQDLEPITYIWECAKTLDQKTTPKCAGYSLAHNFIAHPVPILWVDDAFASKLYHGGQENDEWPGTDYDGTSCLGVLKYAKKLRLITGWKWAFTHRDAQLGISHVSPGYAGSNWYTGMMTPDADGFIHVTGQNEGGHAYLYIGIDIERQAFIIKNSWGTEWGKHGDGTAFISFDDYEKLRSNYGEMAFIEGEKDIQVKGTCDSIKTAMGRYL